MPTDWFDSDVKELVSDRILKDVAEFWEKNVSKSAALTPALSHSRARELKAALF